MKQEEYTSGYNQIEHNFYTTAEMAGKYENYFYHQIKSPKKTKGADKLFEGLAEYLIDNYQDD